MKCQSYRGGNQTAGFAAMRFHFLIIAPFLNRGVNANFVRYGTIIALEEFRGSAKVAVKCNHFLTLYVKATRARMLLEHLAHCPVRFAGGFKRR